MFQVLASSEDLYGVMLRVIIYLFKTIYIGAYLTVVFGVLNLVIAVVVRAMEHAGDREADERCLLRIFEEMDQEKQGSLSYDRLMEGARNNTAFRSRLWVMNIRHDELQELWKMNRFSEAIDGRQFTWAFRRKQNSSYSVVHCIQQQEELARTVDANYSKLSSRMDQISKGLEEVLQRLGSNQADVMVAM